MPMRTEAQIREQIERLRRRIDEVSQCMYGAHTSQQMKFKFSEIRALLWASMDELLWVLGGTRDDAWRLSDEGDSLDAGDTT